MKYRKYQRTSERASAMLKSDPKLTHMRLFIVRGYKWSDLMEQIQRERAEREARQRAEDLRAKREEKVFLAGVERGRVEEGMAKKNDAKRKRQLEAADTVETTKAPEKVKEKKPRRTFVQNDVVSAKKTETIGDDAKRVLGKIF